MTLLLLLLHSGGLNMGAFCEEGEEVLGTGRHSCRIIASDDECAAPTASDAPADAAAVAAGTPESPDASSRSEQLPLPLAAHNTKYFAPTRNSAF